MLLFNVQRFGDSMTKHIWSNPFFIQMDNYLSICEGRCDIQLIIPNNVEQSYMNVSRPLTVFEAKEQRRWWSKEAAHQIYQWELFKLVHFKEQYDQHVPIMKLYLTVPH